MYDGVSIHSRLNKPGEYDYYTTHTSETGFNPLPTK